MFHTQTIAKLVPSSSFVQLVVGVMALLMGCQHLANWLEIPGASKILGFNTKKAEEEKAKPKEKKPKVSKPADAPGSRKKMSKVD